jgi:hypothetical protein
MYIVQACMFSYGLHHISTMGSYSFPPRNHSLHLRRAPPSPSLVALSSFFSDSSAPPIEMPRAHGGRLGIYLVKDGTNEKNPNSPTDRTLWPSSLALLSWPFPSRFSPRFHFMAGLFGNYAAPTHGVFDNPGYLLTGDVNHLHSPTLVKSSCC